MNPLRPTWTARFKEHLCLLMTRHSPKSRISTRSRKHTNWELCLHQRPRRMMRLRNDSKIPCWVQSPWGDHEQLPISSKQIHRAHNSWNLLWGGWKMHHFLSSRCCSLVWDMLSSKLVSTWEYAHHQSQADHHGFSEVHYSSVPKLSKDHSISLCWDSAWSQDNDELNELFQRRKACLFSSTPLILSVCLVWDRAIKKTVIRMEN